MSQAFIAQPNIQSPQTFSSEINTNNVDDEIIIKNVSLSKTDMFGNAAIYELALSRDICLFWTVVIYNIGRLQTTHGSTVYPNETYLTPQMMQFPAKLTLVSIPSVSNCIMTTTGNVIQISLGGSFASDLSFIMDELHILIWY